MMNDNITTKHSDEAVNPRFCKGAVSGSASIQIQIKQNYFKPKQKTP